METLKNFPVKVWALVMKSNKKYFEYDENPKDIS